MSLNTSDYNKDGVRPVNVAISPIYSDLDLRLFRTGTNDISPLTDINAVKNAVKNLVLTNFNDRPYQPQLGSNVRALLFEPANAFTAYAIKEEIGRVLEEYEPRINKVVVDVTANLDSNEFLVTIQFNILTIVNSNVEVSFYLSRLR